MMDPIWKSDVGTIYQGHTLDVLKQLPDESVHCCVTSPPYWGLRDYGLEPQIWNGDVDCEHEWGDEIKRAQEGSGNDGVPKEWQRPSREAQKGGSSGQFCQLCGAWKGNLGLEPTRELYVKHIVDIFREVKRVLRNDGTLWLNLGDSYNAGRTGGWAGGKCGMCKQGTKEYYQQQSGPKVEGLKPKDLIGIPWRVAFALQADGWYLRSDIIWHKPNPMPESCTDRPTKAHEYLFLMSKNQKYFYDADAVRETHDIARFMRYKNPAHEREGFNIQRSGGDGMGYNPAGRNKRSVWTIATQPFPEAHFATFPEKLIEPCILAGTSEKGCCVECGAPWERVVDNPGNPEGILGYKGEPNARTKGGGFNNLDVHTVEKTRLKKGHNPTQYSKSKTIGWQPSCKCYGTDPLPTSPKQGEDEPDEVYQEKCEPICLERIRLCKLWAPLPTKPGVVMDIFIGAGTSAIVAYKHNCKFIGIDLSETYLKDIAIPRIEKETKQLKLFK